MNYRPKLFAIEAKTAVTDILIPHISLSSLISFHTHTPRVPSCWNIAMVCCDYSHSDVWKLCLSKGARSEERENFIFSITSQCSRPLMSDKRKECTRLYFLSIKHKSQANKKSFLFPQHLKARSFHPNESLRMSQHYATHTCVCDRTKTGYNNGRAEDEIWRALFHCWEYVCGECRFRSKNWMGAMLVCSKCKISRNNFIWHVGVYMWEVIGVSKEEMMSHQRELSEIYCDC